MQKDQSGFIDFDDLDDKTSLRPEAEFGEIVKEALSRRDFLKNSLNIGLGSFVTGIALTSNTSKAEEAKTTSFSFTPVEASTADTISIPNGYKWDTLVSWGDPLWSTGVSLDEKTGGTAQSQLLSFGDNNDGMSFFTLTNGKHLLVVNNEFTNPGFIFANRKKATSYSQDDVLKSQAAHGVTVVEVSHKDNNWSIVTDSIYNRRITANTDISIEGPLRGNEKLKTSYDPKGILAKGTWNNCANGKTPWGTYLTCEENFNTYFSSSDPSYEISTEEKRYLITKKGNRFGWARFDSRFDISKEPNEPNRSGFVVEIDPEDPTSTPRKLTALGRVKHENAELVIAKDKKIVVYMGDDDRGEYLYRFISKEHYHDGIEKGNTLLNEGTLYAAKFHPNGTGEWLELTPKTTAMTLEEICLYTRVAADKVKATTMDRPEWVSSNPTKLEVVCALTNNSIRGAKDNQGGQPMTTNAPNPRKQNIFGQIVRWVPDEDHTSNSFKWDLFAMAGNPEVYTDAYAGSDNISPENMFNAPDGMLFDRNGLLWFQTDGSTTNVGPFKGMGNNQMLVGNTTTGEIKRFLVGPKGAEITGGAWSSDYSTMFVGIQHPGAGSRESSHFPLGAPHMPRSSVIAIRREDGEPIV